MPRSFPATRTHVRWALCCNIMTGLWGAKSAAKCRALCTTVRAYGGANRCGKRPRYSNARTVGLLLSSMPHWFAPPYARTEVQTVRQNAALFAPQSPAMLLLSCSLPCSSNLVVFVTKRNFRYTNQKIRYTQTTHNFRYTNKLFRPNIILGTQIKMPCNSNLRSDPTNKQF